MDKVKKYVLILSLFLMILCGNVHAQTESIVVKYNNTKNVVTVFGDMGVKSGLLTTVSFYEYGTTLGDTNLPKLFGTAISDADGEISCELIIPDALLTGKYSVLVKNEENTNSDLSFIYSKVDDVKKVMGLMNGANTQSEIEGVIKNNPYALMLDGTNLSDTFVNELAKAFYALRSPDDYTDYLMFQSDFEQSKAAVKLNSGADVKNTLEEVSAYTGFNLQTLAAYPAKVQELMLSDLKTVDYSQGLLSKQIPQIRTLAFFKSSETWGSVKLNVLGIKETGETYIDNFLVLSPSLEYYSKVKNINSVFEKLFSYRNSINTFADLKTYFEKSAQEAYEEENSSGKNESGGGGSSGGTGGVTNFGPIQQDTIKTEQIIFNDISEHWAKQSIEELYRRNIISGYPDGSFGPSKHITRAEFTKLLVTVAGYTNNVSAEVNFTDVPKNSWYYEYVAYAKQNGIINGISDTLFSPDTQITRQDVCVAVYRYISEKLNDVNNGTQFSDDGQIADYAKNAVEKLSGAGIINGYGDGSFAPYNKITRAEATVILTRLLDFLG